MTSLAGTAALTRLALRLDRVRLPVWVVVVGLLPAVTAAQYQKLYPNPQSLAQVTGVLSNTSLVALNGPLFDGRSIGGLTAWKIMVTELILIALMSLLTVIRHTRAEEEAGRLELLSSGVLGRYAPLSAALLTASGASLATGLIAALGLLGARQPAAGSVALGAAVAITGVVFAAVAGVTAQLTEAGRTAIGIAVAVLGGAYLVRAIGDTGPTWVSWISPIGWAMRSRPFAGNLWWAFLPGIGLAGMLAGLAYAVAARRDLAAGILPARSGRATALPSLRTSFSLAWRLHRGLLLGWAIGMVVWGYVLGGAADSLGRVKITDHRLTDLLDRLGGRTGLANAFLAAVLGITGLVVAAYTVQATLRLRIEEAAGRVEPLLATATGRIRWAFSHLIFAIAGTAVLLGLAGAAAGVAYGARVHDVGGQTARLFGAALAQAPAAWVLAGVGIALFGLVPRWTGLAWAALVGCLIVLEVGEILGLSQWLLDISPFAHVPKLPGSSFTAVPLLWLAAIAAGLVAGGLAGFRRRDLG